MFFPPRILRNTGGAFTSYTPAAIQQIVAAADIRPYYAAPFPEVGDDESPYKLRPARPADAFTYVPYFGEA